MHWSHKVRACGPQNSVHSCGTYWLLSVAIKSSLNADHMAQWIGAHCFSAPHGWRDASNQTLNRRCCQKSIQASVSHQTPKGAETQSHEPITSHRKTCEGRDLQTRRRLLFCGWPCSHSSNTRPFTWALPVMGPWSWEVILSEHWWWERCHAFITVSALQKNTEGKYRCLKNHTSPFWYQGLEYEALLWVELCPQNIYWCLVPGTCNVALFGNKSSKR